MLCQRPTRPEVDHKQLLSRSRSLQANSIQSQTRISFQIEGKSRLNYNHSHCLTLSLLCSFSEEQAYTLYLKR